MSFLTPYLEILQNIKNYVTGGTTVYSDCTFDMNPLWKNDGNSSFSVTIPYFTCK